MIRMVNYYRMVGMILLIGAVVICPSVAYPQWTTAGSTGTVDDGDVSPTMLAVFSGPTVTVNPSVAVATLDIRYNVVRDIDVGPAGRYYISVRFRDNGDSAQVIVSLKRHDVLYGPTTTLMTWDSNTETPSNDFQHGEAIGCLGSFSFADYVYYIEVALKKFSSAGNPGLSCIQLFHSDTPCP